MVNFFQDDTALFAREVLQLIEYHVCAKWAAQMGVFLQGHLRKAFPKLLIYSYLYKRSLKWLFRYKKERDR